MLHRLVEYMYRYTMVWLLMRAATSTRATFREEAPYSCKRPCSFDDDATWIMLEETMCVVSIMSKLSQIFSPLLDLCSAVARCGIFISRARFFSSLSSWHLQSASARAGADRTFSDQYLGQVPGGQQMKKRERSQGTAASGLLIMLVANRTPRMVHCA